MLAPLPVYPEHELLEYLSTHDVHFTDLSRADSDQLKRSRELLEFFYQDRGYLLAEVQTAVPPLIFQIVEGPKVASIRVDPEGNYEIGDKAPGTRPALGASAFLAA